MRPSQRDATWPSGNARTCWGTAGASLPVFLRETGIGHQAASEGSESTCGATASISSSRNPSATVGGRQAPVLGSQVTLHTLLHRGHSSGPDPEAQPPPPSRGSCLAVPLPWLSPGWAWSRGTNGAYLVPTLRLWPSAQCRAGVLTPRDTRRRGHTCACPRKDTQAHTHDTPRDTRV